MLRRLGGSEMCISVIWSSGRRHTSSPESRGLGDVYKCQHGDKEVGKRCERGVRQLVAVGLPERPKERRHAVQSDVDVSVQPAQTCAACSDRRGTCQHMLGHKRRHLAKTSLSHVPS